MIFSSVFPIISGTEWKEKESGTKVVQGTKRVHFKCIPLKIERNHHTSIYSTSPTSPARGSLLCVWNGTVKRRSCGYGFLAGLKIMPDMFLHDICKRIFCQHYFFIFTRKRNEKWDSLWFFQIKKYEVSLVA